MKLIWSALLGAMVTSILTGCTTVGPDYEKRMPVKLPEAWNHRLGASHIDKNLIVEWWHSFEDPVLNALVLNAQANNLDLRTSFHRLKHYEIQFDVTETLNNPTIDAIGSGSISESNEASESVTGFSAETEIFATIGTAGRWEIDLFGRIERQIESISATSEAAKESYRDILVSLNAEIASTYIDLRSIQEHSEVLNQLVINRELNLKIANTLYRAQLGSEVEVERAYRLLLDSKRNVHQLASEYQKSKNKLSYMLGLKPGELPVDLSKDKALPDIPSNIVVSIPRDVIRQRPDIREAERLLAAQTAHIGMASADLYPRLSLNGIFGFADTDASLVSDSALFWTFGPRFTWNIFDSDRTLKRIKQEENRTEQARLAYEKAILNAFAEVESNLQSIEEETSKLALSNDSLTSSNKSLQLARTKFQSGLASYQVVLEAEQALLSAQSEYLSNKATTLKYFIALYRSMGGGWSLSNDVERSLNSKPLTEIEEV